MTALAFDTHEFIKELKAAGFSEEQAEVITKLQKTASIATFEQAKHEYNLDNFVTNKSLDSRLRETDLKIELVRAELKKDIAENKSELIRWVVGVGLLQITIITALLLRLADKIS